MTTKSITAKIAPMTSREQRGKRLKAWADEQRGRTAQLVTMTGLSRSTVENAYAGAASTTNYVKLEAAMTYIEDHPEDIKAGPDFVSRSDSGAMIEFEVTADAVGVRVIVRGSMQDSDELAARAAQVIRELKDLGQTD